MRLLVPLVLTGLCATAQAQDAAKRWVHGSWINVRSGPAADSPVVDHLSTNQVVNAKMAGATGPNASCEITWGENKRGFVACKLLGERALTSADLSSEPNDASGKRYSPARAFWLAPSMAGLFTAGQSFWQTLLTEEQRKAEHVVDAESKTPPRLVRYPVPEFEAMKALMAKGVVAGADQDPGLIDCSVAEPGKVVAFAPFDGHFPCTLPGFPKLGLPAARPSLFRNPGQLAPGNASVEHLSARFAIVERGRVLSRPMWSRGYDDYQYTGSWDIGKYQLTLDKPVIEHVVGRSGLLGAYQWTPQVTVIPNDNEYRCDGGLRKQRMGKQLVPGYPQIKDALLWFQTTAPMAFKKVKVVTRTFKSADSAKDSDEIRRVSAHEVDIDGDGVADFVEWDMWRSPQVEGGEPVLYFRAVYINMNGVWHPFDFDSYGECT